MRTADAPLLWDFLYLAIYVPEGGQAPDRSVLEVPEIRLYAEDWGREGDFGFVAEDTASGLPIGAAWLRRFDRESGSYGFIDESAAELSVSILPVWRGRGLGTALLSDLLGYADREALAVSLSVQTENPAVRLYERLGFNRVSEISGSMKMLRKKPY